jgi:integrase/recombinase XerC
LRAQRSNLAQLGAALGMTVEDVYTQNRQLWVRLREKGGKRHAMPCHHNLEEYLTSYLDSAELRGDPKGSLFRTIGRATGITAYLKNGDTLEKAAAMANHASTRTTQL